MTERRPFSGYGKRKNEGENVKPRENANEKNGGHASSSYISVNFFQALPNRAQREMLEQSGSTLHPVQLRFNEAMITFTTALVRFVERQNSSRQLEISLCSFHIFRTKIRGGI